MKKDIEHCLGQGKRNMSRFCKLSGRESLRQFLRYELHVILGTGDINLLHQGSWNPVKTGGTFFLIPAPAVEQPIFFHIQKHHLNAQIGILQEHFDPI